MDKFSARIPKKKDFFCSCCWDDEKSQISIQKRRPKFFLKNHKNEMNEKILQQKKLFCKS
jgi:hypothetical protein